MRFLKFKKEFRKCSEYDSLMEWKEREHFELNSNEFIGMLFIHDCFDKKIPIKTIRSFLPKDPPWKLEHILIDIARARLAPKRLYVNWTCIKSALFVSSKYDPLFHKNQTEQFPFGY